MTKEARSNKVDKVTSSSKPAFAQGGPAGGMHGRTAASTAPCGETAPHNASGKGSSWAAGGNGPMASRTTARTRTPGETGGMA